MRRLPRTLLVVLALITLSGALAAPAAGRQPEGADDRALIAQLEGRPRVSRHLETGRVRSLLGTRRRPLASAASLGGPASAAAAARVFLSRYGDLFGLASPGRSTRVARQVRSTGGVTVVHLQQVEDGIPVLGGELVAQVSRGMGVISVHGEATPDRGIRTRPDISAARAARVAVEATARAEGVSRAGLRAERPGLWIYDPRLMGAPGLPYARLVWRTAVRDRGGAIDRFVAVDARSGTVALQFDQRRAAAPPADARQRICDQGGQREGVSDQLPCTAGITSEPAGSGDRLAAWLATEATYDFYADRFDLDLTELIGRGTPARRITSTVRYCPTPAGGPCPYANAFWDPYEVQMVYGAGFAAADDVVGHELTHGVTERSSNLFYYYQSGAINEALSDIFGELIDQTDQIGRDTSSWRWLVGEDIPGIGAIRSMKDPTRFGDPDRMASALYEDDPYEMDGGGVHYNSGVANKAAFLMIEGQRPFNGVDVAPLDADLVVSVDKAARIWYDANTQLLTTASDYADLADALELACTNLVGQPIRGTGGSTVGIIDAADCATVTDAVSATEMRTDPPRASVARAPICGGDATPVEPASFADPFDAAGSGWRVTGDSLWSIGSFYGTSGSKPNDFHLVGDAPGGTADSAVEMSAAVAVPGGAAPVFLRFRRAYGFDDGSNDINPSANRYDGGVVEVSTDGGASWRDIGTLATAGGYDGVIYAADTNPLRGRRAFTAESHGYGASRFTLNVPWAGALDLAGSGVRVRFRIGTDRQFGDYGWFIDDVRIYRCEDASDTEPPAIAAPVVTLRTGTLGVDAAPIPVRVGIDPNDASGIAWTSIRRAFGPGAAVVVNRAVADRTVLTHAPASAATDQVFSAAAMDDLGNVTQVPRERTVRLVAIQETSPAIRFVGSWTSQSNGGYDGGRVRYASVSGRKASAGFARSSSLGWVTTTGPDRGKARVCVGGSCSTVDLYSPTTRRRQLVWARSFAEPGGHTISVTVLGVKRPASSGTRVDLDAFVAITQ